MFPFVPEEPYFPFHTSSIPDERSICSDDTVTGDDDDDRVFVIRSTDSTYRFRISCEDCLFFVAPCLTIGDALESFPCLFLEHGSLGSKGDIKCFSFSLKILSEFRSCLLEDCILSLSDIGRSDFLYLFLSSFRVGELEHDELSITRYSEEITERGWDDSSRE